MTPICSILIPTRKRPVALMDCLQSIHDSVDDLRKVEICVRYDQDDDETHVIRARNFPFVRHWVRGPRFNGYYSLNKFYTELAMASKGRWVFLLNDDCQIFGDWIDDLAKVQTTGFIVHPQRYQVGDSMYEKPSITTCPIVPNYSWHSVGLNEIPAVTDAHLVEFMQNVNGWKPTWLPGLHLKHARYPDEVYAAHRKLT